MSDPMIEARELHKRYGPNTALHRASFEVRRGEVVGLLGPNGAGKSTTMKILTCYIAPTSGTARVNGCDVFDDPVGARSAIGYLPESTPLYPEMMVLEYLEFMAAMRGHKGVEGRRRIKTAVEQTSLGDVIGKEIRALSKGYKQRVGLAQALVHEPPILILDEPMSGLDPNQAAEIRDLIREIGESRTVILSTHNLAEVQVTCGRVLIIAGGKIVADDTPDELTERAGKSKFVATIAAEGDGTELSKKAQAAFEKIADVASVRPRTGEEAGELLFDVLPKRRRGPPSGRVPCGRRQRPRAARARAPGREPGRHLPRAHAHRRQGMKNIMTIAGRQFRSYWNGPTAYIVLSLVLGALGWFFWSTFFLYSRASVRNMFQWIGILSAFATPALAMGLLADEKRQGTIELLLTLPVKDHEIVAGKFLGVLGLYAVLLALTLPYPIAVAQFGPFDAGPVVTGYVGVLLQGAAMLGIGIMASSLTENQVVAFFIAISLTLMHLIVHSYIQVLPASLAGVIDWFTMDRHLEPMARGVIDMRDLVYFVSLIALALGITTTVLESRRWS